MIRPTIAAFLAAGFIASGAHAASFSTHTGASAQPTANQPAGTACGTTLLTQNANRVPTALQSVSCNSAGSHADNSYLRAFNLGAFPAGFDACAVEFGIEQATAGGAGPSQPVDVRIYANSGGAFPAGTRTLVASSSISVPNASLTTISVPLTGTIPAGAELVAEVFTPDGQAAGHQFFIGSNNSPETGPSYIQAAACGLTSPTPLASIGFADMHIILDVRGTPVAQSADLSIAVTDGVTSVSPGGSTTYTITATNPVGGGSASPVAIVDTFPAGLTCTWTSSAAGGATGNTASGSGNINDTAVTMPAGSAVVYTATCAIGAAVTGTIANTATVSAPAGLDPAAANNSATDTDSVTAGANVLGTATISRTSATIGQGFDYTVVLANIGAGVQGNNAGNEFVDVLPAGVTAIAANATTGTASIAGNVVSWNGSIPAGASATITIRSVLTAGAIGATINNQGTISYDSNGDGTNDATRLTDNPLLPGAADATGFVVGGLPSIPVPADARWALALLVLTLGLVAAMRIRAKR